MIARIKGIHLSDLGSTRRLVFVASLIALLGAQGCVSPPLGDLPRAPNAEQVDVLDVDYVPFRVSPRNRYAIVMNSRSYTAPTTGPFSMSTAEDVLAGKPVLDPFIQGDVDHLGRLLLSKGYDVYRLDFGRVTPDALHELFKRIGFISDDETQLFVAYSGEGDSTGLRTRTLQIRQNQHVVPPGVTLTPKDLFSSLAPVQGPKAVLINACEAGVFTEEAAGWGEFSGVVIGACPRGFATTPHEPSGTTAIFASFLELYTDDPRRILNLGQVEIDRAGGLWTNLAHHWSSFWGRSGLPLSYEPAIFVSGDFWF